MGLQFIDVSKSFGKKAIFEELKLTFKDTGIYALVGKSGRGKTTLLRMIAGLDKNYSGTISGVGKVSFAFQEYRLFPNLSAIDNVFFANFHKKNEAEYALCKEALASLGFSDDDMSLLPGEMSGGMKQRVSLARAFLREAPILLLDEPTKELDPKNSELVRERIRLEGQHRLVILVSHDVELAQQLGAEVISL